AHAAAPVRGGLVGGGPLAPSAVGVRACLEPCDRALDVRCARVLPRREQSGDGQPRAVERVDAPASGPAPVAVLRPAQVLRATAHAPQTEPEAAPGTRGA